MVTATAKRICSHCGGTLIIENEDGEHYCLLCGRPYHDFRDYGRMGGQRTLAKYGHEHFVALGRRGGRPRTNNHGQLPVPEVQLDKKEERLPNSLKELKELYRLRNKQRGSLNQSLNPDGDVRLPRKGVLC